MKNYRKEVDEVLGKASKIEDPFEAQQYIKDYFFGLPKEEYPEALQAAYTLTEKYRDLLNKILGINEEEKHESDD